ncbi:hypothetical protein [Variovorax sp.]|uniref:hypothetical protein n=1 Tax=Variovorax sp. TaxID=1871043 RepID=UPI001384717E|nr:hypothetical protein [Variovorax sp.]KAF1072162.1 MAG: hypothetical protein GAK39_00766 [Variovorax sp.]
MTPLTQPDRIRLQIEAAAPRGRDDLFLACSNADARFEGFARLCQYRAGHDPLWRSTDLPATVTDGLFFSPPPGDTGAAAAFVFLTEEGDVMQLPPGGEAMTERIEGAGLWSDDSEGWGSMIALAQIGGRLHACGGGGQIYRRTKPGAWEHMDTGLLREKGEKKSISFKTIAGANEQEIYAGGWFQNVNDGVLYCGDGRRPWKAVASGMPAISRIHVEREDSVWACGRGGTLLHGNHVDGFQDVSALDDTRAYVDVTSYDGQIFLATETGLYLHANGATHRIRTRLDPEYEDGHLLRVVDGVLWSIGYADIARFDGTAWERIPFPGNPPIR